MIAVGVEKLIEQANIEHSRPNVRVAKLLKALEETAPIQQIEPSIEKLRLMKSKDVEKRTLRIYLPQQRGKNKKSNPKGAKGNPRGAKSNPKGAK